MEFRPTKIPDVVVIEPKVYGDHRGFFMETWQQQVFSAAGIDAVFVQDNHSKSSRGILRGLHYQVIHPQGKLVRVTSGEVYDVVVDIRKESKTYGQWVGMVLSGENKLMMWVPPGFAHGFYVISEFAEFTYKCTDFYAPEYEKTILWEDPDLAIDWPIKDGEAPILSGKDKNGDLFKQIEAI